MRSRKETVDCSERLRLDTSDRENQEGALRDGIEKLEWLVGKQTLENEVLRKGSQNSLKSEFCHKRAPVL